MQIKFDHFQGLFLNDSLKEKEFDLELKSEVKGTSNDPRKGSYDTYLGCPSDYCSDDSCLCSCGPECDDDDDKLRNIL